MINFITLESIILDSSKDKISWFLVGPSSIKDQSSRHKKNQTTNLPGKSIHWFLYDGHVVVDALTPKTLKAKLLIAKVGNG